MLRFHFRRNFLYAHCIISPIFLSFSNSPTELTRYTSAQLGAHSTFASYLALDGDFLATHDRTSYGKVSIWNIAENGTLNLNKFISSPHTTHDSPTFGESIFISGNRLGIGSGNTWRSNPHD